MSVARIWFLPLLVVLGAIPAVAQAPLTLAEALARADSAGYANRAAAGASRASAGAALAPLRGILPAARLEAGYVRTTDPLNAFGFLLRQRGVTPAAFQPGLLNNPSAIGNLSTGLVVEQPLFNADAWLGRIAARRAEDAARGAQAWTRAGTAVEVYRTYWGAVLAGDQVSTLQAAWEAAREHERQADAMVREGMATRSDLLLAQVRAGEIEASLLAARSQTALGKQGLALLMGSPADTTFTLPLTLPDVEQVRSLTGELPETPATPTDRADVRSANAARAAAQADARRAGALYLPRLNGFGRLDWNDDATPFGGKSAWTVGVMLSWSPFSGASERAEIGAARGRVESARALADAAVAGAGLEWSRARSALTVALARLEISARGVEQAREAHRIVGRKYAGGLASISELLDAAAMETGAALAHAAARYDALVAAAELETAAGRGLTTLIPVAQ